MEPEEREKKLEKFIKKLENLDIREWAYHLSGCSHFITEIYGLRFKLRYEHLEIENITEGPYSIHYYAGNIENKLLKKMLIDFYNTTYKKFHEHQKKELEEKLDLFLSE